jgi:hypothetical protein
MNDNRVRRLGRSVATVLSGLIALGACADPHSPERAQTDADPMPPPPDPAAVRDHDGGAAQCRAPIDCRAVDTLAISLQPCCTASIACGYELTRPEELRGLLYGRDAGQIPDTPEGRCVALEKIFVTPPTRPEKRVEVPGAEPIFYTPECVSRAILAYPFVGCCMASGECGISTDVALGALSLLALPFPSPLTRAECTTARKVNEAFLASSSFAGFAHFEDTTGRCDYAGLAARLAITPASSAAR